MSVLALHAGWDGPGPWVGLVWLVVVATVIALFVFRASRWRGRGFEHRGHSSAEAVLAERYARGEITEAEYRKSRAVLRENGS